MMYCMHLVVGYRLVVGIVWLVNRVVGYVADGRMSHLNSRSLRHMITCTFW